MTFDDNLLRLPAQLVGNVVGAVDLAKSFHDRSAIDGNGPRNLLIEDEVEHQRLDVPIEDNPDQLGIAIDDRAARVAADDIGRTDKVEWSLQVDLVLLLDPAFR